MKQDIRAILIDRPALWDIYIRYIKRGLRQKTDRAYARLQTWSTTRKHVCFLQIGANDGLRNDPVREFVVKNKWTGCFVEPHPVAFCLLKKNYAYLNKGQLFFENVLVGASNETTPFFHFSKEFLARLDVETQLSFLRKSSLSREHLESFVPPDQISGECITSSQIPCADINALVNRYSKGGDLDLLVMDVEGYEFNILNKLDFSNCSPNAILYESSHDDGRTDELLISKGYKIVECGQDTFAAKE